MFITVLFNLIFFSDSIDIDKTNHSFQWNICHYRYFFSTNFKFQPNVRDGCHSFLQKAMGSKEVKGNIHGIHFWDKSKNDALGLVKKTDLSEKIKKI